MKLAHSLFTAAFIIVAAGCSATTSDSGDAASGGDTGSGGADTGSGGDTAKADTGTASETSGETGTDCPTCALAHCKPESDKCGADTTCQAGIACLQACQTSDAGASDKSACENTCITNAKNDNLNAYVACLASNCKDPCGL